MIKYIIKISLILSMIGFIIFLAFAFFMTAIFILQNEVKYSLLSILSAVILLLLIYWLYKVIVKTKQRSLHITKILAMSKDGYETEISRVQSKRNLFKFIKSYLTKETNFVSHPEEYWWKR